MPYLQSETINHWQVVCFQCDRLTDPFTVAGVMAEMDQVMADLPDGPKLALNFREVEYVSSQVIGMLLNVREQMAARKGTLVLCKLGKHVLDVLKITKLDRHFTVSSSLSAVTGRRTLNAAAAGGDVQWMG